MSRKTENLQGQVFGNLKVINHVPDRKCVGGNSFWKCKCICGNVVVVRADNLKLGHSTQCVDCARMRRRKVIKFGMGRK